MQLVAICVGPAFEDAGLATGALIGAVMMVVGFALLIAGLCYYAAAKGYHPAWGLMGLLSIVGLIVLACLPDRHLGQVAAGTPLPDISEPAYAKGPIFQCLGCGYTLNGITSRTCPECGRAFDPDRPETMRVTDADGVDWFRQPNPPWTARWSLMCGLLSLAMLCFPFVGTLMPLLGVIFGHIARAKTRGKHHFRSAAGVSLIGLIVSYVMLLVHLGFNVLVIYLILDDRF